MLRKFDLRTRFLKRLILKDASTGHKSTVVLFPEATVFDSNTGAAFTHLFIHPAPPLSYPYISFRFHLIMHRKTSIPSSPLAFLHLLHFHVLLPLHLRQYLRSPPSAYLGSHSLSSAEVESNLKGRAICMPLVIGRKRGGEVGGGCFTED